MRIYLIGEYPGGVFESDEKGMATMPEHVMTFRINEVPVLVGAAALVLWLSGERLIQLLGLRQPKASARETLSIFWSLLFWFGFYGAVFFSFVDATIFHWTTVGSGLSFVRYAGIPLVLAGFVIRIVSRLTLGKHFSCHVQTTEHHTLITTGIYHWIRHPLYLGYLCLLLGLPICFGSIGGLACAIAAGTPALIERIRIEEASLLRWFPDEYDRYKTQTSKLLPRLW